MAQETLKAQKVRAFQKKLLTWHDEHGRHDLPWQINQNAYTVWLSEIMLQQTQVKTVIPYFERFITRFPTITDLANAEEEEVLNLWQGLGYYARARRLHQAAQLLVQEHAGQFPKTLKALCQLPGIGRSTAGAILAMGWQQHGCILDGNVKRVLCRFLGIADDISRTATQHKLWHMAEQLTPKERVAQYTQAIMDFGATLCRQKQPDCQRCPMRRQCAAYQTDQVETIPCNTIQKNQLKQRTRQQLHFVILSYQDSVLLEQRPKNGIWGHLWAFPDIGSESLKRWRHTHELRVKCLEELPTMQHQLTHRQLDIRATQLVLQEPPNLAFAKHFWYNLNQDLAVGVPKPVAQLLSQIGEKT